MRLITHFVVLAILLAANAVAQQNLGGCPVLPGDNIWNTPVDQLPVSASSAAYVTTIGSTLTLRADFGSGLFAGGPIGIPFVVVSGTQTKYPVTFQYADESDPGPYAAPLNAPVEGGSQSSGDRHVIAIDKDNCVLYELYAAYPQSSAWKAGSGAIYNLRSNTLRPSSWTSADAAGLPILPGLVRYDEVATGEIRHAIRFTVPQTRRSFVWPARHFASNLTGDEYPPMGQRFRLKADYDISGFSPDNQVILRALKKYGMILADNGSAWYLSGAPDDRWDNNRLRELLRVTGSNLEAVDVSSLMVNPNSGQVRSTASAGDSLLGSFTHVVSEGGWNTRQVLLNTGASSAQTHLKFFNEFGADLSLPLTPPANSLPASSFDQTLAPNALSIVDTAGSADAPLRTGWAELTGAAGVSGFGIFSNPGAKWAAAVPLESRTADAYFLAFDNTGPLSTGIALANVSSQPANISVIIRADTGDQIMAGTISLTGQGHVSFMLNQQYPVTAGRRGSIEFDTPIDGRISVLGLRANGPALTTLPVLASPGSNSGSIAHVTYNGGFTSVFYIVNTGASGQQFTLSFFDENGAPLQVPLSLPQTGTLATVSELTRGLAPGGMLVVETQTNDLLPSVVGSAQLKATGGVGGFEIFRWTAFGQEASVPVETRAPSSFALVFDNTGDLTTGVALANSSGAAAGILVNLRDEFGAPLATNIISLPAKGHTSFMLPGMYTAAAGKRGTAEFVVPTGGSISVIGLRATSDGKLTTIPPLTR